MKKLEVYELSITKEYTVEITVRDKDEPTYYEMYLYNRNYGVKSLMFGSFFNSFEECEKAVLTNFAEYCMIYQKQYEN